MNFRLDLAIAFAISFLGLVNGHGSLIEPPSRASMWRYGYKTPANFNDNQLFCGGFWVQWDENDGKCGLCGDDYSDKTPRDNEDGGKFGSGIITQSYKKGQVITVGVDLSANHLGWFEFSICPLDNNKESEECFNKNILQLANSSGTQYEVSSDEIGLVNIKVKLPQNLTCKHCTLRWHYNTGNSWGVCSDGSGAIGCGAQETFRSCSDISIS